MRVTWAMALAAFGCVLVAGCGGGGQVSPVAPDVPAQRFHIRGIVTDRVERPLAGALVALVDGPLAGTTMLTSDAGTFEFSGATPGVTIIRASKDGFHTRSEVVRWQPSTDTASFAVVCRLDTLEPPIGPDSGDYTLTVAIDLATATNHPGIPHAPCAGFPVDLASRTYRVTIVEASPPGLGNIVRSVDPALPRSYPLFGFSVVGPYVGFNLDGFDGLFEDQPGFRFLDIGGDAPTAEPATRNGASVAIPFRGEFRYCQMTTARGIYNDCSQVPREQIVNYYSCVSDHITMVFRRN